MPRFTIRDVLWLTLVVALAVGWCVDHFRIESAASREAKWESRHQTLVENLKGYGWQVTWVEQQIDPVGGKGGDVLFLEPPPAPKPSVTRAITQPAKMITAIRTEVPPGTTVARAKVIMEGQGFECSVKKGAAWRERDDLNYLYCDRTEDEAGLEFVVRRWQIALIFRGDEIVEIDASTGLIGP